MSDIEQAMADVQALVQQAHLAQAVTAATTAYDNFAIAAMQEMLRSNGYDDSDCAEWIAQAAWKIADAMMAERKKRGLGGFDSNGG